MATYETRAIKTVEAEQFTGDNIPAVQKWMGDRGDFFGIDPEDRGDNPDATGSLWVAANSVWMGIEPGEWIIEDEHGFYPCKPDVFAKTYKAVTR